MMGAEYIAPTAAALRQQMIVQHGDKHLCRHRAAQTRLSGATVIPRRLGGRRTLAQAKSDVSAGRTPTEPGRKSTVTAV